jgi:hypothetical protein
LWVAGTSPSTTEKGGTFVPRRVRSPRRICSGAAPPAVRHGGSTANLFSTDARESFSQQLSGY